MPGSQHFRMGVAEYSLGRGWAAICSAFPYFSDVSKVAFEEIPPLLGSVRKQSKPRTVDLYHVFCGVLYLLKSACQWRKLPREFPKWRTVHADFAKWSEPVRMVSALWNGL